MASLLRSWARRAARLARDMQDVSPISASNETVASFQSERCVSERWRAWSDAPHGGTSTSSVAFVETGAPHAGGDARDASRETDRNERRNGALFLRGVLSTKTTAPLRDARADSDECIATNVTPPDPSELDPESLLTERETARSGYESRLAAVGLGGGVAADGVVAAANERPRSAAFGFAASPAVPPVARLRMRRSGFAGCSTVDLPVGEYLDLDAFTALRYRVLSDGRKYVVSIRTENWITGQKEDLWQAFLFSPAGRWADVYVPMKRFLKTWRGRVMEHEHEMRASRVVGLGIAVAGGGEVEPEGPFAIKVASIAGVRLGAEALEMARRREEAAWASGAPSPGIGDAGEQTGDTDAWGFAERNESDGGFDEEPTSKLPKSVAVDRSGDGGVAPDDLLGAARALRRAAERERVRLAAAAAPLEERKRKPKFKGEMLPEFLGRKPEE